MIPSDLFAEQTTKVLTIAPFDRRITEGKNENSETGKYPVSALAGQ
jgi:hypothetical protein